MKELFKVHHQLIGEERQSQLAAAKVAIIGLGGLGTCVAQSVNRLGIGHLQLWDDDTVEASNLPRQVLYAQQDIGSLKVHAAKEKLLQFQNKQEIEVIPELLTSKNAERLKGADLALDCTDNFVARYAISKACEALAIPMIFGGVDRFEGQVGVFNHQGGLPFHKVFPDAEVLMQNETCEASGVLPFVVQTIGNYQVAEAFKVISGHGKALNNQLFVLDFETSKSRIIQLG